MRCDCCNRKLNDYETTLRHTHTGEFLNTCMKCIDGLGIPYTGREDLEKSKAIEEEEEQDDWDIS